MKKESFYFESKVDGKRIHAVKYIPETEVNAVLQIAHGMVEYVERYEDFAEFLCQRGILVVGNDHRGHGSTVESDAEFGYFCEKNPAAAVLSDLHTLTEIIKEEYTELPYFLLGHSMGSFFARRYLCEYGELLSGAIIMGTGCQPRILVKSGKLLTRIITSFKSDKHRSPFIESVAFGAYNNRFKPQRTNKDWLTKDEEIVDKYIAEKRCSFQFTLNGYYGMFDCIDSLYNRRSLSNMPKELPVLFVSGSLDPVGEFEKGVRRAYSHFEGVGMKNIQLKFYEDDRHEILNETDRSAVYEDIHFWIENIITCK